MAVFKNPFFFIPCLVFVINQLFERIGKLYIPYVHAYLDDLMAMPVILGITLQIYQWIHPAREKFTFTATHVIVATAYVSLVFEWLLPMFSSTYTRDWLDLVCYGIGAVYFYWLVNRSYSAH